MWRMPWMVQPPSTTRVVPLTREASSLAAEDGMARAILSGAPRRRTIEWNRSGPVCGRTVPRAGPQVHRPDGGAREVPGVGGAEGRRAVVTGAASGIGVAVVERLLRHGASVVAVDVNAGGMAPLAEAGAETIVASVAEPADRDRLAETAGAFDYLVNSAGVLFVRDIFDVR